MARQKASKRDTDDSSLRAVFGDKPHLPLFKFPPLIRAYVVSSRDVFENVLSVTPRSAIDGVDATGSTALSWAVRCNDYDSVKQLLLCGSDPSHQDSYGWTPLHVALFNGNVDVAHLLLAAKANPNLGDERGLTALHRASLRLDCTTFVEFLLSYGASLEVQASKGFRPLHHAVSYNAVGNMHLLLERGADLNAATKFGSTALMLGVRHNAHKSLKLLLREEALEWDRKDNDGHSLLELAALYGDQETLHILQSSQRMETIDWDDGGRALRYAQWRRDDNEAFSLWAFSLRDEDPLLWYSAFEAFWSYIAEAQRWDIKEGSETGLVEGEQTHEEEDPEDEDEDSDTWESAPESPDGSTN